jgi:hypothetical protein
MNYIKHLTGFFEKVTLDKQLNPTHISLYIALFQFWNCNRFKNPISISRDEVMRISKISSKATYHKCLKALHSQGYIKYEPSYNPFKGSHVFLFNFSDDLKPLSKTERSASLNFEPVGEQVVNKLQAGTGTSPELVGEQVLVPSINNINITNNSNIEKGLNGQAPENKIDDEISELKNVTDSKEEKSSVKKEEKEIPEQMSNEKPKSSSPAFADYSAERTENSRQKSSAKKEEKDAVEHIREVFTRIDEKPPEELLGKASAIPVVEEVLTYFHEQNFPDREANKFFNYFQSIGWLVGGKTPMADWQAAARNWILNAPKFISNERTDGARDLDTSAGKDYSEPL